VKKRLRFLDAEQVVGLHDELLSRWGGAEGGGHRGESFEGVDAAVQAVKNSYYDTVVELAAAYGVYIVQGHVFLDGNKRTGAAAMRVFLEMNGERIRPPPLQIASKMVELQKRGESGERAGELVAWLATWLGGHRRRAQSRSSKRRA
jgi:death-on-curing protein